MEPDKPEPGYMTAASATQALRTGSLARRLINHPWVVGIGTIVVCGVVLALILGHG
jgi:hypothetical protein